MRCAVVANVHCEHVKPIKLLFANQKRAWVGANKPALRFVARNSAVEKGRPANDGWMHISNVTGHA